MICHRRRRISRWLIWAGTSVALSLGLGAAPAWAQAQLLAAAASDSAVRVTAKVNPHEASAELGLLSLSVSDAATGQPLDFATERLAAWVQKRLPVTADADLGCVDKVRQLASPGVGRRAVVDLNTFRLLAVNEDHSLTVINPFVRLSNARLQAALKLPAEASAVLHREALHEVWIAMPAADALWVVDTDTLQAKARHALPSGAAPAALAEAGGAVWLGMAGRDEWLRWPSASAAPEALLAPRVHAFIVRPSAPAPLGLADGGVVLWRGQQAHMLAMPGTLEAGVWSELAQRYVLGGAQGLYWLDAEQGRITRSAPAVPASRLASFDGGRWLLAAGGAHWQLVDLANGSAVQGGELDAPISDIAFSDRFAYLLAAGAAKAALLSRADLVRGQAREVIVATGATPAGAQTRQPLSGGLLMQALPDGTGMYVANPLDGQVYQYAEGMMAPAGSFSNGRQSPRALLLLRDGLRRTTAGHYEATLRLPPQAGYELVVSGIQPRFAHCSALALPPGPPAQVQAAGPRPRLLSQHVQDGVLLLRVDFEAAAGQTLPDGPVDLTVLAFDRRSGWQAQQRMRVMEDGSYEARLRVPPGQELDLMVRSHQLDLPFTAGSLGRVTLPKPPATGAAAAPPTLAARHAGPGEPRP